MDVAVLGCGYVGLALGEALVGAGHRAFGVRRSDEGLRAVEDAGLTAVRGDVTRPESLDAVPDVDALVFAASSGGGDAPAARAVYVHGLESVIDAFSARGDPPERLLYTSSTGVYGDHDGGWVDETSELRPATEKAEVLVEAETVARGARAHGIDATVARLGGVYGPGRYRIERYLEGPVTEGYLNLIHRTDAGGALRFLLEAGVVGSEGPETDAGQTAELAPKTDAGQTEADAPETDAVRTDASETGIPETVLVVDDEPVWKPDLSTWLAEACGVEPPSVRTLAERLDDEDLSEGGRRRLRGQKRCSNDRLRSLGYEFRHPTFREGYRDAIDERRAG